MKKILSALFLLALAASPLSAQNIPGIGAPMVPNASSSGGGGGAPSGPAGGDLGGTYPNPTVANLSNISDVLNPSAIIGTTITVDGTFGSDPTSTWTIGSGWAWNGSTRVDHTAGTGAITSTGLVIANGGTSYVVNDVITISGGSADATYTVSSVSSGVVTGLTQTTPGTAYSSSTSTANTTGGTGTGLTVLINQVANAATLSQVMTPPAGPSATYYSISYDSFITGITYQVTFTIQNYSGNGQVEVDVGTVSSGTQLPYWFRGNGNYTITLTTASPTITFTPTADFAGGVTSVAVQPITPTGEFLLVTDGSGNPRLAIRAGGNAYSTMVGVDSGRNQVTTSKGYAVAIGYDALFSNINNFNNVGVGGAALYANTTGSDNTAVGESALQYNTSASHNTAVGFVALGSNTTGGSNTAVGDTALNANLIGANNVAVGQAALANNLTASQNTAIGQAAGFQNRTGAANTDVGYNAGYANVSGTQNVAIGYQSLVNTTTANTNTAVGYQAGSSNTTGGNNTFLGAQAGKGATGGSGTNNTVIGYRSFLTSLTSGSNNVAVGDQVGGAVSTGSNNVLIGHNVANSTLATGSSNIIIGTASNCDAATASTTGSFRVCETTGPTPLLDGVLTAASAALTINATLTITSAKLSSPSSAVLQLGGPDAASPTAQAFQAQSVLGGTSNTAGVGWNQQASLSTGTGTAGSLSVLTGFAGLSENATITASSGTGGNLKITYTTHGLVPGSSGQFTNSGGALPGNISGATNYFVCPGADFASGTFNVSATYSNGACGTLVVYSSAGSGTNTFTTNTTVQNPASAVAVWGPSGLTGSQTTSALSIAQTWNTSGVATGLSVSISNIASGGGSFILNLLGGTAGATSEFSVGTAGGVSAAGTITSTITTGSSSGFVHNQTVNGILSSNFGNTNAGSSALYVLNFKTANATATQGTIQINGNAFSGGNGANAFTVDGVTALYLQGANTNAMSMGASGAITIYNQPTTGAITYGVCAAANANGATGGALILDTSATVCGLSSMAFKKDIAAFDLRGMTRLASLDPVSGNLAAARADVDPMEILRLSPAQFVGDGKTIAYDKPSFGIMAQDACDVDERLCARFADGTPRTPIPSALMALQVGFDQKLYADFAALRQQFDAYRASRP